MSSRAQEMVSFPLTAQCWSRRSGFFAQGLTQIRTPETPLGRRTQAVLQVLGLKVSGLSALQAGTRLICSGSYGSRHSLLFSRVWRGGGAMGEGWRLWVKGWKLAVPQQTARLILSPPQSLEQSPEILRAFCAFRSPSLT